MAAHHVNVNTDTYEQHMLRITELESDLGATISAMDGVRNDKEALKQLYDDLRTAHSLLKSQNDSLRRQNQEYANGRQSLINDYEDQTRHWRAELENKNIAFDEMEKQLAHAAGRDMDLLKLKIAEELEAPFQMRLRAMEQKVAQEQKKCSEARRQAESWKLQAAQYQALLQDKVKDLEDKRKAETDSLKRQLRAADDEANKQRTQAAACAGLRATVQELGSKLKVQQSMIADQASTHEKSAADLMTQISEKSTAILAAQKTAREAKSECEMAKRKAATLEQENSRNTRENADRIRNLQAAQQKVVAELADYRTSHEQALLLKDNETHAAIDKITAQCERLREELATVRSGKSEQEHLRRESERTLAKIKESTEHEKTTISRELADAKESSEIARSTLQTELDDALRAKRQAEETKETECDALQRRIEEMSEEMVKLQGSHAKSEKQIADHKAAVESKTKQHRDAEDRFSALETAHMALQREHKELHKGHQEHQATAKALQQELAGQSGELNKERNDMRKRVDEMVEAKSAELNAMKEKCQQLQEFAERAQREIDEHKKRVSSAEKKAKGTRKEDRKKLLAVLQVAQSLRADKETMAHLLEQEKIHHEARSLESQRKEREMDAFQSLSLSGASPMPQTPGGSSFNFAAASPTSAKNLALPSIPAFSASAAPVSPNPTTPVPHLSDLQKRLADQAEKYGTQK